MSDIFNECFTFFITLPFASVMLDWRVSPYLWFMGPIGVHAHVCGSCHVRLFGSTSGAPPNCQHKDFGSKYPQTLFAVPDRVRHIQRLFYCFVTFHFRCSIFVRLIMRFYVVYVLFRRFSPTAPDDSIHGIK